MAIRIDSHLDWVRYTVPYLAHLTELQNLDRARWMGELFQFTGELIDIGQGYNKGLRMVAGAIFWHDSRPEQGVSVQMTGEDMQSFRAVGLQEKGLLQFIRDQGGHCSTLHGCINVRDGNAKVSALISDHEAGKLPTRARSIGVYSSKSKVNGQWVSGDTLYVGSAKSAVQIRIYDKAAEQGVAGDWTRIEIVWRGRYARAAHEMMMKHGIPAVIRTAIGAQLQPRQEWWAKAMEGKLSEPIIVERRETERMRWLREVVAPALDQELQEQRKQGKETLFDLFWGILEVYDPQLPY